MLNKRIKYSSLIKFGMAILMLFLFTLISVLNITSTTAIFSFLIFLGMIIILYINSPPLIKYLALTTFLIKSIILFFLFINNKIYMFPDSYNYIINLNNIANLETYSFQTISSIAGTLHAGFYYLYSFIFNNLENPLSILLINTLFTVISGILFYEIFKERFSHKIAFITFIIFNLSANIFLFGSLILKDPIVIFLSAVSLYLYVKKKRMFLAIIIAIILVTVRIYAGFAIILAILFDFLYLSHLSRFKKTTRLLLLVVCSMFFMSSNVVQAYIASTERFIGNISVINAITTLPSAILKFFFSPLPWNIINNNEIYRLLILDSILFIFLSIGLMLFIYKWIKFSNLRRNYYLFLIPILIHAVTLGIQYGGDSTRQRSGIYIFLVLTLITGFLYKKKPKEDFK